MKILQVNTVLNGCTGRIARGIKRVAEQDGNECMIAYGRGNPNDSTEGTYCISSPLDYCTHALITRVFDSSGLHSRKATSKFIEFIEEYEPDVLHIHNLHGYYINYPMFFQWIKNHRIKTVWTLHDCWPFTGHCPYYTYAGCMKWKDGCYSCQQKHHHPASYVFDRSKLNYVDKKSAFSGVEDLTIVTPSLWLANEVSESFLGAYKTVTIPNGISLSAFRPTSNDFRTRYGLQNKIVVLGVSNLWAETKGLHYFVELAEQLPEEFKIVIVGLSDMQQKKLPDKIIGIKKTEDITDLADIYSSSDVFVNPTLEDNFPTTNIESLACGTPVITFNTGGSPEALDSKCGLVVDKNVESLREGCLLLGKKSESMVRSCLDRAAMFEESKCFGRYLEIYGQR